MHVWRKKGTVTVPVWKVPEGNWVSELAQIIDRANSGDHIVVDTPTQAMMVIQAAKKLEKSFIIRLTVDD